MTKSCIPVTNADNLSNATMAALRACNDLMEAIAVDLKPRHHSKVNEVLAGGGRIGMEFCMNRHGKRSVSLVAVELEGARSVIVEIAQEETPEHRD